MKYKVVNGTSYNINTPDNIINILERLRANQTRVRFAFGDPRTGRDWEEVYDIEGRIGRSTGQVKIPLLIHNARSYGGGGLLTANIVKIEYANKRQGGVIWKHPNYHKGGRK